MPFSNPVQAVPASESAKWLLFLSYATAASILWNHGEHWRGKCLQMTFSYGYVPPAFLNGSKSWRLMRKGQIYYYFYCCSLQRPQRRPRLTDLGRERSAQPCPKAAAWPNWRTAKGKGQLQHREQFVQTWTGTWELDPNPTAPEAALSKGTMLLPDAMFLIFKYQKTLPTPHIFVLVWKKRLDLSAGSTDRLWNINFS